MERYTISDFNREFSTDAACLEYLRNRLYPDGVECKLCKKVTKHHRDANRPSYSCDICGHHVHPTAGTIFHKSSTPLRTWFHAIFRMASTRCGISAKTIERETGVTYKTAWRMFKQIRSMLAEDTSPLSGTVEIDETGVGGQPRYQHGQAPRRADGTMKRGRRPASHPNQKTTVIGAVERHGRIWARVVPDGKIKPVLPEVTAHILPSAMVYTDEAMHYSSLWRQGYQHRRVHHAAKVYVDGDVSTNTIEGFWSLFKRSVSGSHHSVSAKYLPNYLDEYCFRYSHRHDERPMFQTMLRQVQKA